MSRTRAFDRTLSNTLEIGGYYQDCLTKNGGKNENLKVIEKVKEMLQIWREKA